MSYFDSSLMLVWSKIKCCRLQIVENMTTLFSHDLLRAWTIHVPKGAHSSIPPNHTYTQITRHSHKYPNTHTPIHSKNNQITRHSQKHPNHTTFTHTYTKITRHWRKHPNHTILTQIPKSHHTHTNTQITRQSQITCYFWQPNCNAQKTHAARARVAPTFPQLLSFFFFFIHLFTFS